jgi:hypothetical protein
MVATVKNNKTIFQITPRQIKCAICGTVFFDAGSHPTICGSLECATEAYRLGMWSNNGK